uniref:Uncharacterized protein n=1 Tax=Prymnesium polylepis TaxID=72548 RepID=A0A7S4MDW1_9EUKA|mmetsp:Transcript_25473/g.63134  ORF Transcript_25473/g.63134 Transcript_25473/m.63134 type:complete len:146 (+) Transcript_25473:998-1435(+)|eukprot:3547664-Prymnesium_polylepis.1
MQSAASRQPGLEQQSDSLLAMLAECKTDGSPPGGWVSLTSTERLAKAEEIVMQLATGLSLSLAGAVESKRMPMLQTHPTTIVLGHGTSCGGTFNGMLGGGIPLRHTAPAMARRGGANHESGAGILRAGAAPGGGGLTLGMACAPY